MKKRMMAFLLCGVMLMFSGCAGREQAASGTVYYLNFKPEADSAWRSLAKTYSEQTGVTVKVVTAASGTYEDTLTAEMGKSEMPTLFQVSNAQGLRDWGDYCLDLSGTAFAGERTTRDFDLYDENDTLRAIGYCYEAYGIIVNKALLQKAGYTAEQITDFASLKRIAEDIHARAGELGFDAFTSAGLDSSSSWRFSGHLAGIPLFYEFRDDNVTAQPAEITGKYLDNYRSIWDLYIQNSATAPSLLTTATGDMSQAEFGSGKAVFWQQGSWEYPNLVGEKYGMKPEDLTMLPIYCGAPGEENAGLCCGTENYWAVNAKAPRKNIDATLEFLRWVVTSDEGTEMMAKQFGPIPFRSAKTPENVFFAEADRRLEAKQYTVTWAFSYTPNVDSWRSGVVTALTAYAANQTDENWAAVRTAFVDGWAIEYRTENG